MRKRIIDRLGFKHKPEQDFGIPKNNIDNLFQQCTPKSARDFQVLTLEEIRHRRKRRLEPTVKDPSNAKHPRKISLKKKSDVLDFKIQSLMEIRSLRVQKESEACAEVTSTSSNETDLFYEENLRQNALKTQKSVVDDEKQDTIAVGDKRNDYMNVAEKKNLSKLTESDLLLQSVASKKTIEKTTVALMNLKSTEMNSMAETFLLDEDEEEVSITIKAEEDILKDIDDLLND